MKMYFYPRFSLNVFAYLLNTAVANHDSTTVVASLLTIVFCLAGKKKQKERKGIGRLLVVRKKMFIC